MPSKIVITIEENGYCPENGDKFAVTWEAKHGKTATQLEVDAANLFFDELLAYADRLKLEWQEEDGE